MELGRFAKKVKVDAAKKDIEEPRIVAQEIEKVSKTFIYDLQFLGAILRGRGPKSRGAQQFLGGPQPPGPPCCVPPGLKNFGKFQKVAFQ